MSLLVAEAVDDETTIPSLLEIVRTETSSIKFACTKIIRMVSEQRPGLVYPYFEEIVRWLFQSNSFIKWDGCLTLANLTVVDREDKFGAVYKDYFALLRDPQMITAGNVIGSAWKIALARPDRERDITGRLLEVPDIVYLHKGEPSPECNRIVCGQVIECFEHYFEHSTNQEGMIRFAEGQLHCPRKSVAAIAEKFLRRHTG